MRSERNFIGRWLLTPLSVMGLLLVLGLYGFTDTGTKLVEVLQGNVEFDSISAVETGVLLSLAMTCIGSLLGEWHLKSHSPKAERVASWVFGLAMVLASTAAFAGMSSPRIGQAPGWAMVAMGLAVLIAQFAVASFLCSSSSAGRLGALLALLPGASALVVFSMCWGELSGWALVAVVLTPFIGIVSLMSGSDGVLHETPASEVEFRGSRGISSGGACGSSGYGRSSGADRRVIIYAASD